MKDWEKMEAWRCEQVRSDPVRKALLDADPWREEPMGEPSFDLAPIDAFTEPWMYERDPFFDGSLGERIVRRSIVSHLSGLALEYKASARSIRQAFRTRQWNRRAAASVRWGLGGAAHDELRHLFTMAGLTFLEVLCGIRDCHAPLGICPGAGWMNQWADVRGAEPPREHGYYFALDDHRDVERLETLGIERRMDKDGCSYALRRGIIFYWKQAGAVPHDEGGAGGRVVRRPTTARGRDADPPETRPTAPADSSSLAGSS